MNRSIFSLAALVGGVLLVAPAFGADTTPAPSAATARVPAPMMAEIEAALATGEKTVEGLTARLATARTRPEIQTLHREIESAKRMTEVSVLRIQAGWARREGRIEIALRLESEAESLLRPRARMMPAQVVPPAAKR